MDERTRAALRTELGGPPPPFLDALSDADLADLALALADARARQAQALEAAIDGTMRYLPPLLRGAVRRVLLG
ncbi:MAG: hypothetical protein ACR2GL_04235 [Thermoleophilaceae bacterium]